MATASNTTNILINQELSIQISLNGLSFCILHPDTNTIAYLKHFNFSQKQTPFQVLDELKKIFNTTQALQSNFNALNVVYINELSTLVPKPLFNENAIADYLKFNSKILQTDYIAQDVIVINNSVNVYVPYMNINNYLYDKFGSFAYKHFSTILVEEILLKEKHAQDKKMYVHVNNNHFEIIVTNQGNLDLYNTFTFTTKEDFIYYILFTAEQLQLNPETLKLVFLGNIVAENELYNIAFKYIRHIAFGTPNTNYIVDQETKHSNYILKHSF
ncbi:DUF3822 family protein [Oceanihabitans sp. 2_MG-2023]|uniref:DUF3822 family protein n=1 Tax=Oceanihabitans sp. 2_MG-2023 TaxID=3062661 RepID=UPI0026E3B254|nr:DUF3822 family protein [Oceanihabitans sp. 2_MG-2023]MDO6597963.1 DUF3822 family protein [Oceanihabitans sp. 2_MG-2023]